MKTLRFALSAVALLLLAAGYAASQVAYFNRDWADYAHRVDQPPIVFASLLLFLVAVGLAFVPEDSEGTEPK